MFRRAPFTIESGLWSCSDCGHKFDPDSTGILCSGCGQIFCPACLAESNSILFCNFPIRLEQVGLR